MWSFDHMRWPRQHESVLGHALALLRHLINAAMTFAETGLGLLLSVALSVVVAVPVDTFTV